MKIQLYAEHCIRAGQCVVGDYSDDSPDVWTFEGSREELAELAEALIDLSDRYRAKCGRSIMDAIGYSAGFRVCDASGEYIAGWNDDGEPVRTPSADEAHVFPSRQEARMYCDRETDRIISDFA